MVQVPPTKLPIPCLLVGGELASHQLQAYVLMWDLLLLPQDGPPEDPVPSRPADSLAPGEPDVIFLEEKKRQIQEVAREMVT